MSELDVGSRESEIDDFVRIQSPVIEKISPEKIKCKITLRRSFGKKSDSLDWKGRIQFTKSLAKFTEEKQSGRQEKAWKRRLERGSIEKYEWKRPGCLWRFK